MERAKKDDDSPKRTYVRRPKSKKKDVDSAKIVYDTDRMNIALHQERLCFHIYHNELREQVLTFDIAEAVAAMMRIPKYLLNREIWKIKLTDKDKEIQPIKALYWLSGGEEWVSLDNYTTTWKVASQLFEDEFGKELKACIKNCQTLGDVQRVLDKKFNLSRLYEMALSRGIAK